MPLPPLLLSSFRSGRGEPSDGPAGQSPRRGRCRAAVSAVFALVFAMVDAVSQVVRWVERGADSSRSAFFGPFRFLAALLLSAVVCWGFLLLVDVAERRRGSRSARCPAEPAGPVRRGPAAAAFLVPLACWSFLYAHLWPLASMNDTAWILRNPTGAGVQHPITYTLITGGVFRLGRLFGGNLAGVVLLSVGQMLLWAGCVSAVVVFLDRNGAPRRVSGFFIAYCALMPLVADYSFAVVKDAVFSLFATLLIPVLLVVRAGAGRVLLSRRGAAIVVAVLAGFALTRNNALPVALVILVLAARWSRAQGRRVMAVFVIALVVVVVPPAATARSSHAKEALGVPLQMVGHALVHDPECLPARSRQVFDAVFDTEVWKRVYDPTSVDPVKYNKAFRTAYLDAHRRQFLGAWARGLAACPGSFITGLLLQTANLWRFDADPVLSAGQSRFVSVVSNAPADREKIIAEYAAGGVVNHSLLPRPLRPVGDAVVRGMELTPGQGTWMWALALSVTGFVYAGRREWVAIHLPMILLWGTLMIAAPAVAPFRYMEPIIMVVPIGLIILLGTDRARWEPPDGAVSRKR